jgi:hypothetical protein
MVELLEVVDLLDPVEDPVHASISAGARPMDGSSSRSSRGHEAGPRPMASICCSPPERVPASWRRRAASAGKELEDAGEVVVPALARRRRQRPHLGVFRSHAVVPEPPHHLEQVLCLRLTKAGQRFV